MYFLTGLLILFVIYLGFKIYAGSRRNSIRRHGHCCDECRVKEFCDEYKKNRDM